MITKDDLAGLDIIATGERIAMCISKSGLSDKELGAMMHVSVQAINKWRHGRSLPDIENMYILSRILGTHIDSLLMPLSEENVP